jgi:hypothetical protein
MRRMVQTNDAAAASASIVNTAVAASDTAVGINMGGRGCSVVVLWMMCVKMVEHADVPDGERRHRMKLSVGRSGMALRMAMRRRTRTVYANRSIASSADCSGSARTATEGGDRRLLRQGTMRRRGRCKGSLR